MVSDFSALRPERSKKKKKKTARKTVGVRVRSSLFLLSRTKLTGSLETEPPHPQFNPPFSHRKEEVEDKVTLGCPPLHLHAPWFWISYRWRQWISVIQQRSRGAVLTPHWCVSLIQLQDTRRVIAAPGEGSFKPQRWCYSEQDVDATANATNQNPGKKRVRKTKNGVYGGGSG